MKNEDEKKFTSEDLVVGHTYSLGEIYDIFGEIKKIDVCYGKVDMENENAHSLGVFWVHDYYHAYFKDDFDYIKSLLKDVKFTYIINKPEYKELYPNLDFSTAYSEKENYLNICVWSDVYNFKDLFLFSDSGNICDTFIDNIRKTDGSLYDNGHGPQEEICYLNKYGKINDTNQLNDFVNFFINNVYPRAFISEWTKEYGNTTDTNKYIPLYMFNNLKSNITRKELCEIVYRWVRDSKLKFSENIDDFKFADCDNKYVLSLASLGIVTGNENNMFNPDKEITRQEASVIICKAYELCNNVKMSEEPMSNINYADDNEFADWGRKYIKAMNCYGLLYGIGNDKFGPNNLMTREEAIYALFKK